MSTANNRLLQLVSIKIKANHQIEYHYRILFNFLRYCNWNKGLKKNRINIFFIRLAFLIGIVGGYNSLCRCIVRMPEFKIYFI